MRPIGLLLLIGVVVLGPAVASRPEALVFDWDLGWGPVAEYFEASCGPTQTQRPYRAILPHDDLARLSGGRFTISLSGLRHRTTGQGLPKQGVVWCAVEAVNTVTGHERRSDLSNFVQVRLGAERITPPAHVRFVEAP